MHLELDDYNLLLEGKLGQDERLDLTEHVVDCERCRKNFKMLLELRNDLLGTRIEKRHPLRYALGVAALLMMSAWPYFQKEQPGQKENKSQWSQSETAPSLQLLEQVRQVNHRDKVAKWGKLVTIQDLIKNS